MKILIFYKTAFPDTLGGIEQAIHQIARGASKLGVQTDVLSLAPLRSQTSAPLEIDGYLSHRAKLDLQIASTGFSVSAFKRFAELAKQADVIHYHFPWPFMDLVHFATRLRGIKKPTILTYQSDIIRQKYLLKLYRPLQTQFLSSVDHIVATSPNYLNTSEVLANYKNKTSIIPIGLDKTSYPTPAPERLQYWQKKLGSTAAGISKFFLFVGVLRYYKGLSVLLDAAQHTPYPIVIIGTGPLELELKAQAARLNLTNIHFLGQLPDEDKVALLTLCYAFVFPSHLRSEAFGISLLEAAMFGKPMISCEIGTGTTFINIDAQTGITVPPNNPVALRWAMEHLWNHPKEAARMGENAEKRYWNEFTADKMVKSYVRLYGDLSK